MTMHTVHQGVMASMAILESVAALERWQRRFVDYEPEWTVTHREGTEPIESDGARSLPWSVALDGPGLRPEPGKEDLIVVVRGRSIGDALAQAAQIVIAGEPAAALQLQPLSEVVLSEIARPTRAR